MSISPKLALSGRIFEKDYKENISIKEFAKIASEIGYQGVELRKTNEYIKQNIEDEFKKEDEDRNYWSWGYCSLAY